MRSVLYAINVKDKIIVSYETLFKAHTMKKTSCNFLEKKPHFSVNNKYTGANIIENGYGAFPFLNRQILITVYSKHFMLKQGNKISIGFLAPIWDRMGVPVKQAWVNVLSVLSYRGIYCDVKFYWTYPNVKNNVTFTRTTFDVTSIETLKAIVFITLTDRLRNATTIPESNQWMYITVIRRCSCVILVAACGYISFTMIKKFFRRDKTAKSPKATDSVDSLEISSSRLSELSKEQLLSGDELDDNVSDSASMKVLGAETGSRDCSSNESLTCGQLSAEVRETKAEYRRTSRKLNASMQKLRSVARFEKWHMLIGYLIFFMHLFLTLFWLNRRKEAKIKRRQKEIVCMHHELSELARLMQQANCHADSLDLAIDQTKMEMASLCSQSEYAR